MDVCGCALHGWLRVDTAGSDGARHPLFFPPPQPPPRVAAVPLVVGVWFGATALCERDGKAQASARQPPRAVLDATPSFIPRHGRAGGQW